MRAVLSLVPLVVSCSPGPPEPLSPLPPVDQPSAYVDPFIGSGGFGYAAGSAFPGALAPLGLAKVGPDTNGPNGPLRFLHFSGYWYGDDRVKTFSHMHLHGTGATDYGVLGVMPVDGFDPARPGPAGYESPFKKASETAAPGYYGVTLDRGGIKVELTATTHAAHHRYGFRAGRAGAASGTVLIDLDHHLDGGEVKDAEVDLFPAERRLRGRLRSVGGMSRGFGGCDVFFEVRTRQPWQTALLWTAGAPPAPGTHAAGTGVGLALGFDTSQGRGEPVEVQVGLSLVSGDNAAANLTQEMPGWDFDGTRGRTGAAWDDLLRVVRVEGGTADERRLFYSALYRAFLMPSVQSDTDGSFLGPDRAVHHADGFRYVSDLSLWDTYRTVNPLYALLAPDRDLDVVRSLHEMARAGGFFPKWPLAGGDSGVMIGAGAEIVIADAFVKGITGFDAAGAYAMLRAAAMDAAAPAGGRGGREQVEPYMKLGYVPQRIGSSVSLTTEYAHDDFALSQLAAGLGLTKDAEALLARSRGYRRLFDPGTGFLRARGDDGQLGKGAYDPLCFCDEYREANGWQSVWMAAHDADGLVGLFGGQGPFVARLSEFFEKAQADWESSEPRSVLAGASQRPYYWGGNEPDIHAAYLFAQAGRPDLAQKWVRWAMHTQYGTGADGLPGNDDGGTMSSWYVFSALGLYPIPGSDRYIVGAPLFPRVELAVHGGRLTIEAEGAAADRPYVQSVELDGVPLATPELRHADLRGGRTLRFVMGAEPGTWGRSGK